MDGGGEAKRTRGVRADARRNEEALLEAAKIVFARSGVDAPIREVAAQAGVGLGTLYRWFPTRADLVAAVFRREIDACADAASALSAEQTPLAALGAWLHRYMAFLATKRGLAAALHSGDSAFASLPDHFRQRFERALALLLQRVEVTGAIGGGVTPHDLLRAIGNLATATGTDAPAHLERLVALLLDGLRFRAG